MSYSSYAPFKPERQNKNNQAEYDGSGPVLKNAYQHASGAYLFRPVHNTLQHIASASKVATSRTRGKAQSMKNMNQLSPRSRLFRLLIISYTDVGRDPRVLRQALALRETFELSLAALDAPALEKVAFHRILRQRKSPLAQGWIAANLLARNFGPAKRRFILHDPEVLREQNFDLVLVNDAEPLPLGFALARGAPVVFDAHEYYPREFESSFTWRLLFQPYVTKLCATYIPRCAAMTTVSSGLAREYEKEFGVLPEIIFNGPKRHDLPIVPCREGTVRLIHHGSAGPDRKLEQLIEMAEYLDERCTLTLMLVGNARYIDRLKKMSGADSRIIWRDPVAMRDISREINGYDLGVYLAPPTNFNTRFMLPNKFFEFIQARLAIAIGPSPEMAAIVNKHDLGVVADDFTPQALAAKLNALTAGDIMRYKHNADAAARIYTAEAGMESLMRVLRQALAGRKGTP
jgi:hypothetical protein